MLRPNDAPRLGSPVKMHVPWTNGLIVEGNAADRDLQVVLDLLFHFARAIPMGEGKAAVDFRFRRILRGEEIVELFLRIDLPRIGVAKCSRALKEI